MLALEQAMWAEEAREQAGTGVAAEERLATARAEVAEAEAELARVQADGPANHRKRDPIDKVCPSLVLSGPLPSQVNNAP